MTDHQFISLDFETRSPLDLAEVGVYTYAEHPETDILCMAYRLPGESKVRLWKAREPFPNDIVSHLAIGGYLRAWNANFERTLWNSPSGVRAGYPVGIGMDRWVCSMSVALAAGLPGKLDTAAKALHLSETKDDAGHRLMLQLAKPRRPRKGETPALRADGTPETLWWSDPVKLEKLYAYCRQDVVVEDAIWDALPPAMDKRERQVWLLDQRMNDVGVRLDLPLIRSAREMADGELQRLDESLDLLTGGAVTGATKIADLKTWVNAQGYAVDSLDKANITQLLGEVDLPSTIRRALEIRQEAGKSSVAKFETMLACVGTGDRARGMLQYYGAGTGRWAARLIQLQNLPKGDLKANEIPGLLRAVRAQRTDRIARCYGRPLDVLSSLLRSCLIPSEGKVFDVIDFASIEARIVAWVAGQQDLVDLFAGGGKVYQTLAARVFGVNVEQIVKPSHEYAIGKMGILGCGFGMGHKKFAVQAHVDEELALQVVTAYRDMAPAVKSLWYATDDTAVETVQRGRTAWQGVPGTREKLAFALYRDYLMLRLPNGRVLWYAHPRIIQRDTPWGQSKPAVQVMALDGLTRQWLPFDLYGGLFVENAVQGIARDLLVDAMMRVDAHPDFTPILTVHDELITESDPASGFDDLMALMLEVPAWAVGLPVAAEGYRADRYRK